MWRHSVTAAGKQARDAPQVVNVYGCSGSGKSTLTQKALRELQLRHAVVDGHQLIAARAVFEAFLGAAQHAMVSHPQPAGCNHICAAAPREGVRCERATEFVDAMREVLAGPAARGEGVVLVRPQPPCVDHRQAD